jgi:hypothetical protein
VIVDADGARQASRRLTVVDAELPQDSRHVVLDGLRRHHEISGDLAVVQPLGDEPQHVHLARGEPGWVVARGPSDASGDGHAEASHPFRGQGGGGPCAEAVEPLERIPEVVGIVCGGE